MGDEFVRVDRKHALWVRWTHWVNFPLLALMVWSGIQIYWAHRVYTPFVPDSIYKTLGIEYHLADGMALHFSVMWLFVINGIIFTTFLLLSGHWRELLPERKTPATRAKFNGAQKAAYTGVFVLTLLTVLTGLSIYKPIQLYWLTTLFGGY